MLKIIVSSSKQVAPFNSKNLIIERLMVLQKKFNSSKNFLESVDLKLLSVRLDKLIKEANPR